MEWSIHDVARSAGVTSRTLRHYGQVGLLPPSRVGSNGYRYYDSQALVRLQRILLLRELGLGLPAIGAVLEGQRDAPSALRAHLRLLEAERERIGRQMASVRTTLRRMEGGEQLMAEEVFDGFDHTQYEQEVVERWGREAYESSDRWWRSLSRAEQEAAQREGEDIARAFSSALAAGSGPDSEEVQSLVERQVGWLSRMSDRPPGRDYLTGLGEMYVADPRFTAYYDRHGAGTAVLVRDALAVYAGRHLSE